MWLLNPQAPAPIVAPAVIASSAEAVMRLTEEFSLDLLLHFMPSAKVDGSMDGRTIKHGIGSGKARENGGKIYGKIYGRPYVHGCGENDGLVTRYMIGWGYLVLV